MGEKVLLPFLHVSFLGFNHTSYVFKHICLTLAEYRVPVFLLTDSVEQIALTVVVVVQILEFMRSYRSKLAEG